MQKEHTNIFVLISAVLEMLFECLMFEETDAKLYLLIIDYKGPLSE